MPWTGVGTPSQAVISWPRTKEPVRQALARFDGLVNRVQGAGGPCVITHGEPHPGNLLRTRTGLRLIDWDIAALARPERDLWWVISGDQDAARYSRQTSWTVNQDALALYRLRWDLDDIAGFLPQIRGPHQQTEDALMYWTELQKTLIRSRNNATGGNEGT